MKLPAADPVRQRAITADRVEQTAARSANWVWWSALPIGCYFVCLSLLSVDAPQNDDFQSVLRDIVQYDTTPDKFQWLTTQYVDHRIAYVRLIGLGGIG